MRHRTAPDRLDRGGDASARFDVSLADDGSDGGYVKVDYYCYAASTHIVRGYTYIRLIIDKETNIHIT